jgi:hypothetical protein
MPDVGAQIAQARQAGYSDADIADYLAKDPTLGPKVAQAKAVGYGASEIVDHLATPPANAPAPRENVFQKAGRLTVEDYHRNAQAYRQDIKTFGAKALSGQQLSLMDEAAPVLDAVGAAFSPLKGIADATFGDKPAHLPANVLGVPIPQWAQDINSRGLTGGDIATFGLGGLGELGQGARIASAARDMGVTARTAQQTLEASRAAQSAQIANPLAQTVQQFDRAGVRPTVAATGAGAAKVAKAVAENPIAGIRARANLQGSLEDTAQAVDRTASQFGNASDRGAAGEAVQQGIKDFNQRFSDRASALYDKVFGQIDAAQQQKLAQSKAVAEAQNAGRAQVAAPDAAGDLPGPARIASLEIKPAPVIQPKATADVLGQINARGDSPALRDLFSTPQVAKLTAAVKDPGSLSFQDLRNARTWVREAKTDDNLRQGVSQADLGRLEGALTQDINANAASIAGPKVARQLQQADQFYRLGSQRIQGALQKFVGKSEDMAGENTYDRISRMASDRGGADSARLLALKKSLQPSEWGDVAASTIQRMGQGKDGFSINSFVTNADKLSGQGKDLLFGRGELRSELDNLIDVARKQKNVEAAANHSNTATVVQSLGTFAGLTQPHTFLPTVAGLFGMGLTGEMLTNPKAVRAIASLGRAKTPQTFAAQTQTIRRLAAKDATLLPVANAADQLLRGGQPLPAAASASPAQSN